MVTIVLLSAPTRVVLLQDHEESDDLRVAADMDSTGASRANSAI
jgi:hypothetical protein